MKERQIISWIKRLQGHVYFFVTHHIPVKTPIEGFSMDGKDLMLSHISIYNGAIEHYSFTNSLHTINILSKCSSKIA